MMKVLVVFALLVVAVFAQQCLPADYSNNVWQIPAVLSAEVDVQPGQFCNKNGNSAIKSCCDQSVLQRYADFWKTYRANLDTAIDNFKVAAKGADAQKLVWASLPEGVDPNSPLFPQSYKDALNDIVAAYKEFLSNGPTTFGTCLKGLDLYYQGILCGFCSPNWNDMVDVNEAGGVYTVDFDLATSTCTKLGEQCLPFVKSIYPVIKSIIGFASSLGIGGAIDFSSFYPCDNDNCPQFACENFVQGFSIPNGNLNFTDVISTTPGTARFINNAMMMTRNPNNGKNFFTRQASGSTTTTVRQSNKYSPSGFDAYAAGNNGGFATAAANSNGGSSAFAIIPSIFVGLIALFFVL